MTAAQPDPYETVRLLPADTFTQQTRDEWVLVVLDELAWERETMEENAEAIVDALLAYLATQQARPMPGGGGQ